MSPHRKSPLNYLKRTLHAILNTAGYRLERIDAAPQPRKRGEGYETVHPTATYAPWQSDTAFQALYLRIRKSTLVDQYRCYELWQLIHEVASLNGALLEVGVWRGGTAAIIATGARREGICDTIYLADTFRGVVKAGERDSVYRGGEHGDASYEEVSQLLTGTLRLDN